MRSDYWSELSRQEEHDFVAKIREFSGKSSERTKWMEDHLTPLLRDRSEALRFRHAFARATLLYHLFAAEGRETDGDAWKEDVRAAYRAMVCPVFDVPAEAQSMIDLLGLRTRQIDLASLPPHSFAVHFRFRLHKPYLSKDDTAVYVLDTPVRKEKVFGLPMVAPTQWKGALRAAMTYQLAHWWLGLGDKEQHLRDNYRQFVIRRTSLLKILGNEKGETADGTELDTYLDQVGRGRLARLYRRYVRRFVVPRGFQAGRLRFLPTFFTQIGLEVINPHERRARAGTLPIYIESVPAKASADFALLYVPFDCVGQSKAATHRQVEADLRLLGAGLRAMFTVHGFGAKTSSGYGVIEETLVGQGTLAMNLEDHDVAAAQPVSSQAPQRPDRVRDFLIQYPEEDFSLNVQEWRKKHGVGKGPAREYRLARDAFRRHQQELDRHQAEQTDRSARTERPPTGITRTFTTLGELEATLVELASSLRQEENHE